MIFNSFTFLIFLTLVSALYWLLPRTPRLYLLLGASLLFYGFWSFSFMPLLLASILVDYLAALWIAGLPDGRRRNAVLIAALTFNIGVLATFKYLVFFVGQAEGLARLVGIDVGSGFSLPFHIVLPLGVSFYTFHSMSYTIDVWRRVIPPTRELVLFANYVVFFPQLVAGPILRAGEVMWQLDLRASFHWDDVITGVRRITAGLFLKCVLADNIAPLVDNGFLSRPNELGAIDVVVLAFLFGFQIYFDFAGYSHIAIGSARMMGVRFPENFDFPYLAPNPQEFWRRWHISLSSWVRDYVYLPLWGARAGTRSVDGIGIADPPRDGGVARRIVALWITWALMGLWHGANWTFVVWGLWHAALISAHRLIGGRLGHAVPGLLGWPATLTLVMLGWIPFRAPNLDTALAMWARLIMPDAWLRLDSSGRLPVLLTLHRDCYFVVASVMATVVVAWAVDRYVLPRMATRPGIEAVMGGIAMAVMAPLVFLFLRPVHQFIYFQF